MTPYEQVAAEWQLPYVFYPPQQDVVNVLAPVKRAGYWLDVGTGKTGTSTCSALYKRKQVLVLVPPILGPMWKRWIERIPGLSATLYGGTPKARAEMKLGDDFIIMSIHIFKRDYDSILERLDNDLTVIVDECTSIKNVGSDNHKAVWDILGRFDADCMLLSGTPLSTPEDGYAYCKIVAPGTYRNLNHFYNVHVASRDFFNNIDEWKNLELLHANMRINSVRMLKEDILPFLPPVTFTPVYYYLDPQHYRLYKKLAEEEVLELESGGKIDATSVSALYHALGQIVVNWGHFADDDGKVSKALDLVEEILQELGTGKLLVFANYRLSNALLMSKMGRYNPAAIYGAISQANQQKAIERFVDDPSCRLMIAQTSSAGLGIDRWQHVCSTVLFLELPAVPAHLTQAVARVHRNGQQNPVHVYLAVADRTLQVRQLKNLMKKDHLVNKVIRNTKDLKDSLFGIC
jgi:SNF2 family DNA or RNA helicase